MMAVEPGSKKRRAVDGLASAIAEAQAELDAREQALEQREAALAKALEGVDSEKRLMAGRTPSDVLQLNVGGAKLTVSRKTLCQYEGSLLAAHFSGRWDNSVDKDADGAFFIDQPVEVFVQLIDFLRAKAIETAAFPVRELPPLHEREDFRRIVDHYGMTQFVYLQEWRLHRGPAEQARTECGPEPSASCGAWSTFMLKPCVHGRRIKSFTVVLEAVERPQIGWASDGTRTASYNSAIGSGEHKGVGEELSSIALDGLRGGVCYQGVLLHAVQLNLQAGTVVTCARDADGYTWAVNGEQLVEAKVDAIENNGPLTSMHQSAVPTISGKGQWRVSQFEYFI